MFHRIDEKVRDLLRPNHSDEDDESSDGAKEDALHLSIVGHDRGLPILDDRCFQMLPAYRLDLRGCRRYHLPFYESLIVQETSSKVSYISDLVCDAREGGTESRWAHLCELYGDDTPRTLHAELYTESTDSKRIEPRWKYPERNENAAQRDK